MPGMLRRAQISSQRAEIASIFPAAPSSEELSTITFRVIKRNRSQYGASRNGSCSRIPAPGRVFHVDLIDSPTHRGLERVSQRMKPLPVCGGVFADPLRH